MKKKKSESTTKKIRSIIKNDCIPLWLVRHVHGAWMNEWDTDYVEDMWGKDLKSYWPTGTTLSLMKLVLTETKAFRKMLLAYSESPGFENHFGYISDEEVVDLVENLSQQRMIELIVEAIK